MRRELYLDDLEDRKEQKKAEAQVDNSDYNGLLTNALSHLYPDDELPNELPIVEGNGPYCVYFFDAGDACRDHFSLFKTESEAFRCLEELELKPISVSKERAMYSKDAYDACLRHNLAILYD